MNRRAVSIAAAVAIAVLAVMLIAGLRHELSPKDPYRECAAVRAWLKKNTNDPSKLEIVQWMEPRLVGVGDVSMRVMTRESNARGAVVLVERYFILVGGKVQSGVIFPNN